MWHSKLLLAPVASLFLLGTVQAQALDQAAIDQLLESAVTVTPQTTANPVADRSADDLRAAAKLALSQTGADEKTVAALVAVYRELRSDDLLTATERATLRRSVTQRLTAISNQLRRQLPQAGQHVLGQMGLFGQPAPAQQPGQQQNDAAQQLIDVIQDTIAPTTWDTRGGQGVIRFWGPGHALIIRQSSDVHGALAQLIEDLHP